MLLKTSTLPAPWTLVEANFKWHARVKCLKTLVERLAEELDFQPSHPKKVKK
jgi:polyphosphate kinase 2 (PPK2 family)